MVSLRERIAITLLPLFVLMAFVGGYGAMLLYRIGGRIDQILRENYASVIYMEHLKEALERMDSSFQFALAGREVERASNSTTTGNFTPSTLKRNVATSRCLAKAS